MKKLLSVLLTLITITTMMFAVYQTANAQNNNGLSDVIATDNPNYVNVYAEKLDVGDLEYLTVDFNYGEKLFHDGKLIYECKEIYGEQLVLYSPGEYLLYEYIEKNSLTK